MLNYMSMCFSGYTRAHDNFMIPPSNGNIFNVAGPLWGESTGRLLTKANDAYIWCFLCSAPEQTVDQILETLVLHYNYKTNQQERR